MTWTGAQASAASIESASTTSRLHGLVFSEASIASTTVGQMVANYDVPQDIVSILVSPKEYAEQKKLLESFLWLRQNNPVGRVTAHGFDPFWVVTTYADIRSVSRQHNLFHSGDRASALIPRATDTLARSLMNGSPHLLRTLLQMDPPDHSKYRHITQSSFTPRVVGSLEARIRAIASDSLDRMANLGHSCDFVRDVAVHYPLRVVMEILGAPQSDAPVLLKLTQDLFRSQDEVQSRRAAISRDPARHARQIHQVFEAFDSYFTPLLEQRRTEPRGDVLSAIANAMIDERPVERLEATSYCMLFATAGHFTTSAAIAGAVWAMCEQREELDRVLSNKSLVPLLVEEAVRWTTPVQHVMRTATKDTVVHGRRIAKGDWLMLCYLSGNRDEAEFTAPNRFEVGEQPRRNLALGHGTHVCLGQHLARLEMRVFFEELLGRLASIELTGVPRRSTSMVVGGPKRLPIKFTLH